MPISQGQGFVVSSDDTEQELRRLNPQYFQNIASTETALNIGEQQAIEEQKYDFSKEIGEAYKSAFQSISNINASNMGQGFKREATDEITAAMQNAYDTSRIAYESNVKNIQSNVDTARSQLQQAYQQELSDYSTGLSDYWYAHLDYLNKLYSDQETYGNLFSEGGILSEFVRRPISETETERLYNERELLYGDTETGLQPIGTGTIGGEISLDTERGRRFVDLLENQEFNGMRWFDYLRTENEKVYDWAQQMNTFGITEDGRYLTNEQMFWKTTLNAMNDYQFTPEELQERINFAIDITTPDSLEEGLKVNEQANLTLEQKQENFYKLLENTNSAYSTNIYVQGLGSGRVNDDIDITIGNTKRKGDGAREYDLLSKGPVQDEQIISTLNSIIEASGDTLEKGRVVVYNDKMYCYTDKNGWVNVESDNRPEEITEAIAAFKALQPGVTNTSKYAGTDFLNNAIDKIKTNIDQSAVVKFSRQNPEKARQLLRNDLIQILGLNNDTLLDKYIEETSSSQGIEDIRNWGELFPLKDTSDVPEALSYFGNRISQGVKQSSENIKKEVAAKKTQMLIDFLQGFINFLGLKK